MRQKRAKSYRKQMLVYQHTFKFREPYQVIVDDELVLACDSASFDLAKGLTRTLQAETKPMITQCCMQALYLTKNQSAIDMAKSFERRRCGHLAPDSKPPHECIKSIVNINGENKHRYVVASENEKLRWSLRKIPGVPLIHMKRSVMIMEPLSAASAGMSKRLERSKLTGGLNSIRSGIQGAEEEAKQAAQLKKKKGPKEPNPLSIKKKKTEKDPQNNQKSEDGEGKKKRKRKHKKKTDGEVEGEDNGEKSDEKTVSKEGKAESDDVIMDDDSE